MKLTKDPLRLRRRAAMDVAKKMMLEPHLAKDMRRILKNILKDFRRTYAAHVDTINPGRYQADTVGALRSHYRKVVKTFSTATMDELGHTKAAKLSRGTVSGKVELKMSNYILNHSEKQASIIIRTTQSELSDGISKAISESISKGEKPDSAKIASLVYNDYSKKIPARAKMISITETQSLAEKTKDEEVSAINDSAESEGDDGDGDAEGIQLTRVWVAVLDDRTRDWHADADGQEAAPGEPFDVDGEDLLYPGDPNGSPENIINCRCTAVPIEV